MRDPEFFSGIVRHDVPWSEGQYSLPVFYNDFSYLSVLMLASLKNVLGILPSSRMKPYRVTPWHCIVAMIASEFRDSDIGPYNEFSIGVPFFMDRVSPLFTGILRSVPDFPMLYIRHLPVTSETARAGGIELAGFPKSIADIKFEGSSDWRTCTVNADGMHLITLSGHMVERTPVPRTRISPITFTQSRLLRTELIWSERNEGISRDPKDVRLELGEHPIAQELRGLGLGKVVTYQYCSQCQAILTSAIESYSL